MAENNPRKTPARQFRNRNARNGLFWRGGASPMATMIGLHAAFGQPVQAAQMGCKVTRGIVDMRTAMATYADDNDLLANALPAYVNVYRNNMILCGCLRYSDSVDDTTDNWPTTGSAEGIRLLGLLTKLATLTDAQQGGASDFTATQLGSRLWVQFGNEIQSGPGAIPDDGGSPTKKAKYISFIQSAITTIRAANANVKIVGPGIQTTTHLSTPDGSLTSQQAYRKNIVLDAYAEDFDLLDVHMHVETAAEVNTLHSEATAAITGYDVVALEWSSANYWVANPTGSQVTAVTISRNAWLNMNAKNMLAACYGPFVSGASQPAQFQEIALTNYSGGGRRDPYYPMYTEIARTSAGLPY